MAPIFIGEANPYGAHPRYALGDEPATSAGGRLRRKILGVRSATYLACERLNLCPTVWNREQARVRAARLLDTRSGEVLILLGRKVADAFGLSDVPAFGTRQLIGGPKCVVLPHPSGRNAAMWSAEGIRRARTAIRAACPEFPLGEAEVATCTLDIYPDGA